MGGRCVLGTTTRSLLVVLFVLLMGGGVRAVGNGTATPSRPYRTRTSTPIAPPTFTAVMTVSTTWSRTITPAPTVTQVPTFTATERSSNSETFSADNQTVSESLNVSVTDSAAVTSSGTGSPSESESYTDTATNTESGQTPSRTIRPSASGSMPESDSIDESNSTSPSPSETPAPTAHLEAVVPFVTRDHIRYSDNNPERRVVFRVVGTTIDVHEPGWVRDCLSTAQDTVESPAQPDGWNAYRAQLAPASAVDANRTHFWLTIPATPAFFPHWTERIIVRWEGRCLRGDFGDLQSAFWVIVHDAAAWGVPPVVARIVVAVMLASTFTFDVLHGAIDLTLPSARAATFFSFYACSYPSDGAMRLFVDTGIGLHGEHVGDALVTAGACVVLVAIVFLVAHCRRGVRRGHDLVSALDHQQRTMSAPAGLSPPRRFRGGQKGGGSGTSLLSMLGFPGRWFLLLLAVVSVPIASPCLVVVASAEGEPWWLRLLLSLILAVLAGAWLKVLAVSCRQKGFEAYFDAAPMAANTLVGFISPKGVYLDDDLFNGSTTGFTRAWGAAFNAHLPHRRWWIAVEVAMCTAVIAYAGFEPRFYDCRGIHIASIVFNSLYAVVIVVARPTQRWLSLAVRAFVAVLLLTGSAIALSRFDRPEARGDADVALPGAATMLTGYCLVVVVALGMSLRNIRRRWQLWRAARADRLQRDVHALELQQLRGNAPAGARAVGRDPFDVQPSTAEFPPRPPSTNAAAAKPWTPNESRALMDSLLDGDGGHRQRAAGSGAAAKKRAAALPPPPPPTTKGNPLAMMPRTSSDDDGGGGGNFAPRGWRQVKTPRKHRASARMAAGRRSRVHLKKRAWSDDDDDSDSDSL